MIILFLGCVVLLCAWVGFVVLTSHFGGKRLSERLHAMAPVVGPVVIASAVTSPVAAILMLLDYRSLEQGAGEILVSLFYGVFAVFFALLLANALLGPASSAILQRLNCNSRLHYTLAGAAIPVSLVCAYSTYDWFFATTGPFFTSLRDQVAMEGLQVVASRLAGTMLKFGTIGALSGYAYRVAMRSNISLQADRER